VGHVEGHRSLPAACAGPAGRHRRVRILAALLALAPDALVRADARAPALFAFAPSALVLADARAPALLAFASSALVLADAPAPALLACSPLALVLADARPPALLAFAPSALVHTVICQHQRIRSKCKDCLEEAAEEADTSMPAGLEELAGPAHAAGKDL
jgi:hypothetical protein